MVDEAAGDAVSTSAMSKPEPIPSPPARAAARSPFVRLAELLADLAPGKPAINLSVGEPQHPVPAFVGPVLAAHLQDFGRYPANKGTERFRHAAAAWLQARYALPRLPDFDSEVLVLNGSREGLFLAAVTAKRFVAPRLSQAPHRARPALRLPALCRRVLLGDLLARTACRHAGSGGRGFCQCGGVPVAVEALESSRLEGGLRGRRQALPRPVHRAAQHRGAPSPGPGPGGGGRGL